MQDYVKEFDFKYYTNDPQNSSIGCDNYFSTEFDEAGDDTQGYEGTNTYDNTSFSSDQ
jgi:hypothetical protein